MTRRSSSILLKVEVRLPTHAGPGQHSGSVAIGSLLPWPSRGTQEDSAVWDRLYEMPLKYARRHGWSSSTPTLRRTYMTSAFVLPSIQRSTDTTALRYGLCLAREVSRNGSHSTKRLTPLTMLSRPRLPRLVVGIWRIDNWAI